MTMKKLLIILSALGLFLSSTIVFADPIPEVKSYNQGGFEQAKAKIHKSRSYLSKRGQFVSRAKKDRLGNRFVSQVEDRLLKLEFSTPANREKFLGLLTAEAVKKGIFTKAEKQHIDKILFANLRGDLRSARKYADDLERSATSRSGKSLLQTFRQSPEFSKIQSRGIFKAIGKFLKGSAGTIGRVVGGILGGSVAGPAGAAIGAKIGGDIGDAIGAASPTGGFKADGCPPGVLC